ncbi:hypothetical protein LCGC14_2679110 [marine sediment metagenome]|uniref:Fido domain-containing protein n=1 Tax=marine sediment metagenome TaxID=412755 RepID=A0A0F9BWL8_9ZZZZ|nr:hypothetical protein [bacterium]
MTWYPDINDLKSYFLILKTRYPDLEKEHLIGDKEQELEGIIDNLQYGLPMEQLDFWLKTVRFLRDLISSHPYTEGNHRLAYISTQIFLRKNGYLLELPEEEAEKFTRLVGDKLAEGNIIRNFKLIAKWLKSKCKK